MKGYLGFAAESVAGRGSDVEYRSVLTVELRHGTRYVAHMFYGLVPFRNE